jgi:NAD(P)H dehydrogenase (quinone)
VNIVVIVGHPHKQSFNLAIAAATVGQLRKNFHSVFYHDLYEENFNPVLTGEELAAGHPDEALVKQHCDHITSADGIVIIHPNWWGQPPAILKGWVDRVLHHGCAFAFTEGDTGGGIPVGLLHAKKAVVFNTSNTGEQREHEVFGDPLEKLWKNCIFNFCGVHDVTRIMFSIVADSSEEQRRGWLAEVQICIDRAFPAEKTHRSIHSQ